VRLTSGDAPALYPRLSRGGFRLADLLRDPADREETLLAVPLLALREGEALLTPEGDLVLEPGDELLFAGRAAVHREVEATLFIDGVADYLVTGQRVPSSWIWRKLSRSAPAPEATTAP
jgi:hypothetical protein